MASSKIPELDPEWKEKVEPFLPKLASSSILDIRALMKTLDEVKVKSLNDTMPELNEGLDINNVMVTMSDGVEREMRIIKPHGSHANPVYIGHHGGGWCTGDNNSEELINRKISKALNVIVFSLDYRLAPENPFPTTFNDAEDGVKWVFSNASRFGGDVKKGIVIGGTSSGGHLAHMASFRAQKEGIPVTGCFMRVPMILNRDVAHGRWKETLDILPRDAPTPTVTSEAVEACYKYLAAPVESLTNAWNFPIFADSFDTFPRTYLQVAGLDPSAGEGLLYEQVLKENGIEVMMSYYEHMPHNFHNFPQLTIAKQSYTDAVDGIKWLYRF